MLQGIWNFAQPILIYSICVAITVFFLVLVVRFIMLRVTYDPPGSEVGRVRIRNLTEEYEIAREYGIEDLGTADKQPVPNSNSKEKEKPLTLFIIDFKNELGVDESVQALRHKVSFLHLAAPAESEVMIRLESGGGEIAAFTLAACQVQRLKKRGVKVTVCIDEIAASGGYMMAAPADKIIATPQAIIGNIGTIFEHVSYGKILNLLGVEYLSVASGKNKRPLSRFALVSEEGKKWAQTKADENFKYFLKFVKEHRPNIQDEAVKEGDTFSGVQALDHGLIDDIGLSDDFIMEKFEQGWNIKRVEYQRPHSPRGKIVKLLQGAVAYALKNT